MKAELQSGEIVTLPKECECITHNEPHWVHTWKMLYQLNSEEIQRIEKKLPDSVGKVSFDEYIAFSQAELAISALCGNQARLCGDAIVEMERRGIRRLIPEASDDLSDDQRRKVELNTKRCLARFREKREAEAARAQLSSGPVSAREKRRARRDAAQEVHAHHKRRI